jgi:hypothetical protein
MRDDNPTVTTTKKLVDSIVQLIDCIDESKHVSIHMVEKKRDKWIGGYNDMWMNEKGNSTYGPLTYVNCFHVEVHEQLQWMKQENSKSPWLATTIQT